MYENSLVLAMAAIFLLSWGGQSLNNWRAANEERREHGEPSLTWGEFVRGADFWERSLENWQSEFLAVGDDGRLHGLPAPARLAGVEAGRCAARRDRRIRLSATCRKRPARRMEARPVQECPDRRDRKERQWKSAPPSRFDSKAAWIRN